MPLTVLFDLDDTLINTNIGEFFPAYFEALGQALSHVTTQEKLTQQINYAVNQMESNQDPGRLLRDIFAENFYEPLGTNEEKTREDLENFYQQVYPKLHHITSLKPEAKALVDWCKHREMTMVVATNPLFPETATRQRIMWAGLDPDVFEFYTTYDNFHFAKPNFAYYAEVLGRLGWPETPIIMVGDNLSYDLLPVEMMGFNTFWIKPEAQAADRPFGRLSDVKPYLKQFQPSKNGTPANDPDVLMGILRATPAVMDTWLSQYNKESLEYKPSQRDWSFVEVLWHIADFEKEIYLPQWEQLLSNPGAVITQPDTSNWAETRNYQSRDPKEAYERFLISRQTSLGCIEELVEQKRIDSVIHHSVFSKTKILELVAFCAKHDRLHLRQCAKVLNI